MLAFVREVSPRLAQCELSFVQRAAIDTTRALRQHQSYTQALQSLGCELKWLPALPQHADAVFVEDTAVIVPEIAVITRPGAHSRQGETGTVASTLAAYVTITEVNAPATIEGGDVMQIGRTFYVGASARTNSQGVEQLRAALSPFGYEVRTIAMRGCLHLKSACTYIPPEVVLCNPLWVDATLFRGARVLTVNATEPFGANTLTIKGTTLVSSLYPRTAEMLEAAGMQIRTLEVDELHKAEAALTCMSLLLETTRSR
jgi:dimethylargininase